MAYTAPVRSAHYLLRHAVDIDDILQTPKHAETNHDLIGDILTGASSFARDVLLPTNAKGDSNPAKLVGDDVIATPGFKDAYKAWVDGGWQTLSTDPEIGGMGLPETVNVAASEMFYGANIAFGLCPMLTTSAAKAIMAHASDELKSKYLSKMISGEWTGAMNLTEPQAGSDLGVLRAKAEPNPDGTYALFGQKIYITWGDHNCAENIIHLVLARLPDAPAGSKGISLFLSPKYLLNEDGSVGDRNKLKAISLEHKLGIHGSPTCVMEFNGATGWLVGEPHKGLACMFTMMNEARLYVGVQGVAIGEHAYQHALNFSKDRVQGRVIDQDPNAPIIGHPDVRRMLIDMKSRLMGARAICMATAAAADRASASDDVEIRKAQHAREALLTPIAKAYGSDTGVSVTSTALQVFGGMGFVEETGAAQHYRDSRIAPIYEGTNGIQAIDLVGRKLRRDGGEAMRSLISDLEDIHALVKHTSDETGVKLGYSRRAMEKGIETLKTATDVILNASDKHALSVATNYLNLCGDVISGALLIKATCKGHLSKDPDAEYMQKLAWYHALAVMPHATAQLDFIERGEDPVFDFPQDRLADL